jgi:hypothetical protein
MSFEFAALGAMSGLRNDRSGHRSIRTYGEGGVDLK